MWKIAKKREKRLPFQVKQLSNDDIVNDKSENSSFHDENDVIIEEDIHYQLYTFYFR